MINKIKNLKSDFFPLIFGIFIVISFMYNYDNTLIFIFLITSVILQGLIYIFYNIVYTKHRILQYVSILGAFSIIGVGTVALINLSGSALDFFVWFISTQDVVENSLGYLFILLVGLNIFISSCVYYFTKVRYRMSVTFILMMIPFAIFAKENSSMPLRFLIPLIILYFSILITYGQNNLYDNKKVIVIQNKSYFKSITSFVLSFMLIISLIPKPEIQANRDVFETLITANNITDFLISQLGFTDTSNGDGFSFSSTKKLYTVDCSETVAIKSKTFSNYNFDNDVWVRSDKNQSFIDSFNIDTNLYFDDNQVNISSYDRFGTPLTNNSIDTFKQELNPSKLLNAIIYACSNDESFSTKYNLKDIPTNTTFKDCTKNLTVTSKSFVASFILNPTNTYKIEYVENDNNQLSSTYSGIISPVNLDGFISSNAKYTMKYYSKSLISQKYAHEILSHLSFDTFGDFLNDLSIITENTNFQDVVSAYLQDYNNTVTYSTVFSSIDNQDILKLAQSITKNCTSDIQKAEALENYFISNGFIYDTKFKRNDNQTIETFLFDFKRGACYEYSTSMILMARAIGLPARYVEGFLVDNPTNTQAEIDITASSSHAYPEVYISGYGWCYFEPTQSYTLSDQMDNNSNKISQNILLIIVSCTLCVISIIAYIFMMFVYPKLYEFYFRKKVLKVSPNIALNLIITRIRKFCKLENSQTLEETKQSILNLYNLDIQNIIDIANQVFYSELNVNSNIVENSLNEYITLYDKIIEVTKKLKKEKRKSKYKKFKKNSSK